MSGLICQPRPDPPYYQFHPHKPVRLFRYVPFVHVDEHLQCGWLYICVISFYRVLMEWRCNCTVPYPALKSDYGAAAKLQLREPADE